MPKGIYKRTLRPIKDRFFRKTLKTDTCWLWQGSRGKMGHGQIAIGGYGKVGKSLRIASRISWEIHFGPIPDNLCVLHKCDVPICVNPDHLFLGTKADNSADMINKGRQKKGVLLPQSKLTDEIVREIRSSKETQQALAKKYGVSQTTISMAKRRIRWTHID